MFVLCLLMVSLCAGAPRLNNGSQAELGDFPYVGCIQSKHKSHYYQSTGTIISKRWVLTSDNAFWSSYDSNDTTFYYGMQHFTPSDTGEYLHCNISKIVRPDETYPTLMETQTDIVLSETVKVGKILWSTPFGALKHAVVVGFGNDRHGEGLHLSYGPVTCNYYCKDVLDEHVVGRYSDHRYVCPIGEDFSPSGYGDGGGPLLLSEDGEDYVVAGVLHNWKTSHYKVHLTIMVYIRTSEYLDWFGKHVPDVQISHVPQSYLVN